MTDPIGKELLAEESQLSQKPQSLEQQLFAGKEVIIFQEEETNNSEKETRQEPWQYLEGRSYQLSNTLGPEEVDKSPYAANPVYYIHIKPVERPDLDNLTAIENMTHVVYKLLEESTGLDFRPNYIPYVADYIQDKRILLVGMAPRPQ
jgi:hypothetical protein